MLDKNGYVKIIDFGLSKALVNNDVAMTQCGTAEYFAPEILFSVGYGKEVDWWAVGILIYEMMFGVTPFFNRNRHMLYKNIKEKTLNVP